MSGDRRAQVEAFFRGETDGGEWVPPAVAFVALLGLGLLLEAATLAEAPGGWLLTAVQAAAYVLAAFLLGWPRVLWAVLPALAIMTGVSHVVYLATAPAWADVRFEPGVAALQLATAVLLFGVVGVGGAAWLWDDCRENGVRANPFSWGLALAAPPAALAAVALLAPADWDLPPLEWGLRSGGPTELTIVAIGIGTAFALAWGLGRWRPAASFTFVDRFLVAGLPIVLVEAVLAPFLPLVVRGAPVLEGEMLSLDARIAVSSGLWGAGKAYLAVALAAGAAAVLLPERFWAPEELEAGPEASDPG